MPLGAGDNELMRSNDVVPVTVMYRPVNVCPAAVEVTADRPAAVQSCCAR